MECPSIPNADYDDFADRLRAQAAVNRIPIHGHIDVTTRCNLRCVHCYVSVPANDRHARCTELSYQEFCSIIDQIVDEGCLWLTFSGGEVFVRPDFLHIYRYAKKKGLLVTIFTNGTLITPQVADYLADWRPLAIEITLYGMSEATYERVTGVAGAYRRCIQAIELLLDRRMLLRLKTTVLALNRHELKAMAAYAEQLGVEFRFDTLIHPRVDGSRVPLQVRLSGTEVVSLDLADPERWAALQKNINQFPAPPENPKLLYRCSAGRRTFYIDANGQLSLCVLSRHPAYDLRNGRFRDGWRQFLCDVRMQKRTQQVPCQTCGLAFMCNQCPAQSQLAYGDAEVPVGFICEVTHLRAQALGLPSAIPTAAG